MIGYEFMSFLSHLGNTIFDGIDDLDEIDGLCEKVNSVAIYIGLFGVCLFLPGVLCLVD